MQKAIIDVKLQDVIHRLPEQTEIDVVYFQQDSKKAGGTYLNKVDVVKKIDEVNQILIFQDGFEISIENIYNIE